MGDMLSQEEIEALLGGSDEADLTDDSIKPDQADAGTELPEGLSDTQRDILGEVGNISMGTSATTLFALLGVRVNIDTPVVKQMSWREISKAYEPPCVGVRVSYTEGLEGSSVLLLKKQDVKIISSLMLGGDGKVSPDAELTDIDLSALGEAMNQMVGSASTSLSSMLKKKIDIDAPSAFIINADEDGIFEHVGFMPDEIVARAAFKMEIGDLINSEIMQVMPIQFAKELVEKLEQEFTPAVPDTQKEDTPMAASTTVPEPQPAAAAPEAFQAQAVPPPQAYNQQAPGGVIPQQPIYAAPTPMQNVNVQPVAFQNFDPSAVMQQKENIDIIMDVPLEITVELGRTHKKIKEILEFSPGTIIELDKLAGEPIDILVNGKFVAKGEVVVIDENFAVRVTEIISPDKRIRM